MKDYTMKREEQYIELIDRYLRNKLSDEELAEFNEMLKNNHEFERTFFEMDQLVSGIRHSAMTSTVEEKLKKLESFLPEIKSAVMKTRRGKNIFSILSEKIDEFAIDLSLRLSLTSRQVKYAMSGICTVVAAVVLIIFNTLQTPGPEALFASNFNPLTFENFGPKRDAGADHLAAETIRFHEAMTMYNNKEYQAASEIIGKIPNEMKTFEMSFYHALTYMNLGNCEAAADILKTLVEVKDPYSASEAQWYLALCLVREGNYNEARALLSEVQSGGGQHEKEAGKLIKKLK
ncbi:MAG TPA: tetratricopeptide repeat protein [Cyclobacteriaceae bacterium]|nr:tetratricopeptide repeat protein [Cyclobacteriaceae bacterium]